MEYALENTKFSADGSKKLVYGGIKYIMNIEHEAKKRQGFSEILWSK